MKIFARAKPRAKIEKVKKISENHFDVFVKQPPVNGKANQAIIKVLAEYFKISPSQIKIISGHHSKQKIIEIK